MKKLLVCALALSGFAASAQAADLGLDSMKDPLPDTISYKGVTVYGTVDVGYMYQTHGVPYGGATGSGLETNIANAPKNFGGSISSLTNNAISQSFVGLKVEESLGYGFTALGKLETGFNPLSGELVDGCASLIRDNGKPFTQQVSSGDSSRCGQAFNGPAYAGLSNASFGTLTLGRQNTLELENKVAYDPFAGSYAFSLIGFSGTLGGGVGDTELGRWDESVKYVYQYGPVHAAGMYASGGQDVAHFGSNYAANAGITWKGVSIDGIYTKEHGGVSSSNFSYKAGGVTANGNCDPVTGNCPNALNATITDNETYSVMGKYVYDIGGGWKDEGPSAKITFFGGYSHIELTNPTANGFNGANTIGGYQLLVVNNTPFASGTSRIREVEWAGAKYETGPWAFIGAYYHDGDNSYKTNSIGCTNTGGKCTVATVASGDINELSAMVDYTFTKHFDVYAGVSWSEATGGLGAGYTNIGTTSNPSTTLVTTGMRLKF